MIVRGTLAKYIGPGVTLVETGTRHGDTVAVALELGAHGVLTIEKKRALYEHAHARFRDDSRVGCYFGSSVEILPKILPVGHPATFWIDAHSTGEKSPILDEIAAIEMAYRAASPDALPTLLIDDVRCYRQAIWGVTLGQVVDAVLKINRTYRMAIEDGYEPGDVLVFKGQS